MIFICVVLLLQRSVHCFDTKSIQSVKICTVKDSLREQVEKETDGALVNQRYLEKGR